MNEEERKMQDNIALVAMQHLLDRRAKLSLYERFLYWVKGYDYFDNPGDIASLAYEYARAMMKERNQPINKI